MLLRPANYFHQYIFNGPVTEATERMNYSCGHKQNANFCLVPFFLSLLLTDHTPGNSSLDTLLALLQAEGAKIEEETEVSSMKISLLRAHTHIQCPAFPVFFICTLTQGAYYGLLI